MTERAVEIMNEKASELPERADTTPPDTYYKSGFRCGYHQEEKELIEKACKWLDKHLLDYWQQVNTDTKNFTDDFRKYMEG